ncbi:MAG TPA: hypothetical protein VEN28_11245, partial [Burkholderiaceae bacterium]|nr:hypothetical protein [Burkholderiaceae bacterium]
MKITTSFFTAPFVTKGRRLFLGTVASALFALAGSTFVPAALADDDHDNDRGRDMHWVASWATSPAASFTYVAPVVQNQALAPAPARFAVANIQPDLAFPF